MEGYEELLSSRSEIQQLLKNLKKEDALPDGVYIPYFTKKDGDVRFWLGRYDKFLEQLEKYMEDVTG